MKHLLFFLCLLAALLLYTCCDDDNNGIPDDDDVVVIEPFEGCCDTAPFSFSQDGINIYLPNAFTPNQDGINDQFYIPTGNGVEVANYMKVLSRDEEVIFYISNFHLNDPSNSWDGKANNDTIYDGLFHIQLKVTDTLGQVHLIEHQACSIPCDGETAFPIDDWNSCTWGLQHNGQGGYDETLSSGEIQCL